RRLPFHVEPAARAGRGGHALLSEDSPGALAPREGNPHRARSGRGTSDRRRGARGFQGDALSRALHRQDGQDGNPAVPAIGQPRSFHQSSHTQEKSTDMAKRVLLVEDNEDVALALTVRLAGAGFDVRSVDTATGGIKALDMFEPDLVLLDLLVPEGGGFSV